MSSMIREASGLLKLDPAAVRESTVAAFSFQNVALCIRLPVEDRDFGLVGPAEGPGGASLIAAGRSEWYCALLVPRNQSRHSGSPV